MLPFVLFIKLFYFKSCMLLKLHYNIVGTITGSFGTWCNFGIEATSKTYHFCYFLLLICFILLLTALGALAVGSL